MNSVACQVFMGWAMLAFAGCSEPLRYDFELGANAATVRDFTEEAMGDRLRKAETPHIASIRLG
jgi:hypothetical protein